MLDGPLSRTREIAPPFACEPEALDLLISADGGHRVQRLSRQRRLMIGTRPECELQLEDPAVSGQHAVIRWKKTHYELHDLCSTNGTFVDGVRVVSARLQPGQRLRLGRSALIVRARGRSKEETPLPPCPIVGHSPKLVEALRKLHKLAPIPHPVMLRGETGTGKELFARTLHAWSPRSRAPFVAVNCAAIPAGLAESELFGHVKGAFTSADRDRDGAFVRADQGTLFLDEVGELPLELQAKLLRVLETRTLRPVGGERERKVDLRIVTATHRDLEAMLRERSLREDLYHRLGVLELHLPPLRERREDIPLLLEHFSTLVAEELRCELRFTPEAVEAAKHASWPGNVRALRNAVTRAAALADAAIGVELLLGPQNANLARCADAFIEVPRGSYAHMQRELVAQIVREEGSIRRASRVLEVPRSTLGAWLRRGGK